MLEIINIPLIFPYVLRHRSTKKRMKKCIHNCNRLCEPGSQETDDYKNKCIFYTKEIFWKIFDIFRIIQLRRL